MGRIIKSLVLLLAISSSAFVQAASLEGDTVNTRWQTKYYDESQSYVVGSDIEDSNWLGNMAYSIDFGVNTISIGVVNSYSAQLKDTIWTFSSLDFGTPITDVTLDTNWTTMNDSWLSFGEDWVTISFLDKASYDYTNDYLVLTLNTEVSAVPLPPAALLFAPALLGFMGLRRKAKQVA